MNPIPFVKLVVVASGSGFDVTGYDTFELKDHIKTAGGIWNSQKKSWYIPSSGLESVRAAAEALHATRKAEKIAKKEAMRNQRIYDKTPEGIAALAQKAKDAVLSALQLKKATGAYSWICCEKCEVIDWQRQHTYCEACAVDYGLYKEGFRVRGNIYTGT